MIGVFCFEETWKGWSGRRLADELAGVRDLGIDVLVTETVEPPHELIGAAGEAGLRTYVSVPCFSAHAAPGLIEGMDVQPIQADGRPRRQMEWYTGLIPTHAGYNEGLTRRVVAMAEAGPAGLVLDFIRWPLHWELELRAGAPEPQESSFDPRSLAAFAAWLQDRGVEVDAELTPPLLVGRLRDRWTAFKCDVITRIACSAADAVKTMDAEIQVGAFIVPGTEAQRQRLLGQDVEALGACLDVLLPMTYHGILHRPVELVADVTTDVARRTAAAVLPVVQVTAEEFVAGPWDWGVPVSPAAFRRAVEEALRVAPGVVLFPLEGLDAPRRAVLSSLLASRTG